MRGYIWKAFHIINRALMSLVGTRLYGWIQIHIFRSDAETIAFHNLSSLSLNDETIKLLSPKQWVQFSKESKEWDTISTSNEDFQEFALVSHYYGFGQTPSISSNERMLEFEEFLEMFKLVAPSLKFAKILRLRNYNEDISKASVSFGRHKYVIIMTKFEEDEMMSAFLTRTKRLQKLQINAFDGGTVLEWKQFCLTNPLKCFKFVCWIPKDINTFFSDFICILPNELEQIKFFFGMDWISDRREQQIVELLQRLTRLSKVHFTQNEPFSMMIAKEISNHANTLQSLTIKHRQYDLEDDICDENEAISEEDFRILTLVSKCTGLTELSLSGFTFCEDQCSRIVANCKSIRRLKLDHCEVSEQCLQVLMSLPNLIEIIY